MSIAVQDIGISEYGEAWDYQDELFKKIVDIKLANRNRDIEMERPGFFLFTEHKHVYTLGKSGDLSNLLLTEEQQLRFGLSRTLSRSRMDRMNAVVGPGPGVSPGG